ncbi:MAG TPA: quinolinate synthase NadA [Rhodospirillales bacterium]|nr:quinolinate synthase NadA [Rhodospirillales bacterium]
MTKTVILPAAGALKETDLDPRFDPWAEIERLRREKNAVILAHFYQDGEIQDLADFVGDSLDLSRKAAATDADMIVFCGVRFMAEVAKILSPGKTVVLPDADAGCTLEDVCQPDDFARFRAEHPDHIAITYINCSAEVKALSDIIVTSSNAEHIINQIPKDQPILFAPDRHLGSYLSSKTGREMTLWDGTCIVHDRFSTRELVKLKAAHPGALVAAHPECPEGLLGHADHIGSTKGILDFVLSAPANEFIVATERHIIHQMEKAAPEKTFLAAPGADGSCNCADCPYMEMNTLEKTYLAMANEAPRIEMPEDLRLRALKPLEKMLDMSPPTRAITQAAE